MKVGQRAPDFEAMAVLHGKDIARFRLADVLGGQHVVLFFYPKDFTFVCPTELHAFQKKLPEFERRGVALIACSTDTEYSHWAWLQMPREQGGIRGITYPIVADTNKTIAESYDVLAGEYVDGEDSVAVRGELVALRALFLIDRKGIVQHSTVNNLPIGRNVDEVLRLVDALQFFETNGEVCPANWHAGQPAFSPTRDGVNAYLANGH
jgi:peroxiredoxin (alkyl hydroperoxide reductase subunit C)